MATFFTFLYIINVVAFVFYAVDKHRAYYNMWRIREAVLLGLAGAGGAYGAGAGMMLFRHKTQHRSFLVTVPIALLVWIAIVVAVVLLER